MDEVLKIFELKGIKGLSGLSKEEQDTWRNTPEISNKMAQFKNVNPIQYAEIEDRLYRNNLFRAEFNNEDLFKSMSAEERDALYKKTVLNKYINNAYNDDPNLQSILSMTPDGQLDFLESGYLNPQDKETAIQKQSELKAINPVQYDNPQETKFGDMSSTNALSWLLTPDSMKDIKTKNKVSETTEEINKKQNEILESYLKKDSNRRIEQSKEDALQYRDIVHKALDNGEMSELELDLELDKILNMSPYYKAFDGSYVFKDLSINKKLEIVSNFQAVLNNADNSVEGKMAALMALNNQIQDYISDHQDISDKIGNAASNATLYGTTAHMMNSMLAFKGLYIGLTEGPEGYNKFMQGLDSEGNPIEDIWNPVYWQGVDMYNTFDLDEIYKAQENGGIHKSQNITRSEEEMDLFSFNTVLEVIKQSKYMNAALLEALLLKGAGSGLGWLGKATKITGRSAGLDKAFNIAGAITEFGVQSAGQSQMEALGAYQEAVEENLKKIDQLVDNEVNQRMLEFVRTPEWDQAVEKQKDAIRKQTYEQLKKQYGERASDYRFNAFDEKQIEEQAIDQINQALIESFRNEISPKYDKDREEARKHAAEGAMTTATVQGVKSAVTNGMFKKLIFSKTTRETAGLDGPEIAIRTGRNGLMESAGLTKWQEYGRPLLNALGEGVDEFSDGYISKLGQGFAVSGFNDYLKQKYDPQHYVEGMDGVLGHFLGGLNIAKEAFFDSANYYEGGIGLLSGAGLNANYTGIVDIVKQYRDNMKNLTDSDLSFSQRSKKAWSNTINKDAQGNELTLTEKLNKFFTNAIIDDISTARAKARGVQQEVDRINKILQENKDNLDKAFELIGSLQQTESIDTKGSIIASLDKKFANSFTLMGVLESLATSPYASEIEQYQNITSTIDRLAEGNINDSDISTFLGLPDNKSVNKKQDATEYAKKQLQENAEAFKQRQLDYKEALLELYSSEETNSLSPDHQAQLLYYKLAKKDWERRRDKMAEELGITINNNRDNRDARSYGNKKVIQNQLEGIEVRLKELNKSIEDNESLIKSLENKEALTEEEQQSIDKAKYENYEYNSEKDSLSSETEYLKAILDSDIEESLLSAQGILSLDPTQMAFMLNPKNRQEFSKEQQGIIDSLINSLKIKDPSALKKIKDIATLNDRINQVDAVYTKSLDNPQLISAYISGLQMARAYAVRKYYEAKYFNIIKEHLSSFGDDQTSITMYASNIPVSTIDLFVKHNPEYKEKLQVGREISQFKEDVKFIIDNIIEDADSKLLYKQLVVNHTMEAQSVEEAIEIIYDIANSEQLDPTTKAVFNKIIERLEINSDSRASTVLQSIKEKKNREQELNKEREELAKKEKEAQEKAEQEAKKEEEKKVKSRQEGQDEDASQEPEKSSTPIKESLDEEDLESLEESYNNPLQINEETGEILAPSLEKMQDSEHQVEDIHSKPQVSSTEKIPDGTNDNNSELEFLSGSSISPYDNDELDSWKRILAPTNSIYPSVMNFLSWMKNNNLDYQTIIDNELHLIAKLNPKIYFLTVKNSDNATHDDYMKDYALSVVEYTPEIARIHKQERGGLLDANGKTWLVLGAIGGRTKAGTIKFKKGLLNKLKTKRNDYFKKHPEQRFFVDTSSYTFIRSIHNGRRVFQNSPSDKKQSRNILDILNDPQRNPLGLSLEDLKWGIQYNTKFLPVNFFNTEPHTTPKDSVTNAGRLFLMLPNADGKLFPVAMQMYSFKDIDKNSDFYTEIIYPLLQKLVSKNYDERLQAIKHLYNYFYFGEKATITIGDKNSNIISFKELGETRKIFDLNDPEFKFDVFLHQFETMKFPINFTSNNLRNEVLLEKMANAGLLQTDFATLTDHNAYFTIYMVDENGEPIIKQPNNSTVTSKTTNSEYTRIQRKSISYDGVIYRISADGVVTDNKGNTITNEALIENIKIALDIQYNNKTLIISKGNYNYYILNDSEETPNVVKMHIRNHTIITASPQAALEIIREYKQNKLNESKENNARAVITQREKEVIETASPEDTDTYNEILNPTEKKENLSVESTNIQQDYSIEEQGNGFTLDDILNDFDHIETLLSIIAKKASEDPSWNKDIDDKSNLKKLLEDHNISTTGILDIKNWLKHIEECG